MQAFKGPINMRNYLTEVLLSILALLMMTACEKESSTLLTDGIWTFEDMHTDSEESAVISLVSLGEAMLTGATLEFLEDGSYILSSTLVENPVTGQWQLVGEDRLILEPEGEEASTSEIETLSSTKLSYSESFVDAQMNTYKVTTTWLR
jgi:hypothetical protein